MGGVLTGGQEACVACGPNFKPLVAEISAENSFPIVPVCWGPTIGFRCEPAVWEKVSMVTELFAFLKEDKHKYQYKN